MKRAKKPLANIFTLISLVAVIVVLFIVNQSQKANKQRETSIEKLTEVQRILKMDLVNDYPKTPREVAKLHGDMTRLLYSGIKDEEIEELAIKIRELCDEEFLELNPMEQYLTDLYSDISLWRKVDRKIENNFIVNEEKEENYKKDGKEYATAYISFTVTEKGKTSELRKYLMRKDKDNRWKILGWEYIADK
ncbi:hypothetical protein DFR55_13422 [Herbinix hemicellulosilytica]|uniref:Uncharacterized protein n=1 Tax=Herbinix hemicellulosilytica TaxID=1564487 RepID=A0A0H5SIV6_HERHM|nr:DUF6715 family protein [Herbinix hemicellulosilytica]RBP56915.1 hypothetical protein DFR55_13422 [Herbinix hemicellulosilytica]CRZ35447.1 hypothetical protein HHT355_2258 [Herbinix hemicellulosilytica]